MKFVVQKVELKSSDCNDAETHNLFTRKFGKFLKKKTRIRYSHKKVIIQRNQLILILKTILVLTVRNKDISKLNV